MRQFRKAKMDNLFYRYILTLCHCQQQIDRWMSCEKRRQKSVKTVCKEYLKIVEFYCGMQTVEKKKEVLKQVHKR